MQTNYIHDGKQKYYGVIMKKNQGKLTEEHVFLTLYNTSLIGSFGVQAFENQDQHHQNEGSTLYHKVTSHLSQKLTPDDVFKLRLLTLNYHFNNELKEIDQQFPFIAYIRYYDPDQGNRGYRPLELYSLIFHEKLRGVKMIQTFIYARGCSDLIKPTQSCLIADYKGIPINKELSVGKKGQAQVKVFKLKVSENESSVDSQEGEENDEKNYIKYHNKNSIEEIRMQLNALARYLSHVNGGIRIVNFKAKFMEQQAGDSQETPTLVYIGIMGELSFDAMGTALENVYVNGQNVFFSREVKDGHDYLFSADLIKTVTTNQHKTLKIDPNVSCAGRFCTFFQDNPHKFSASVFSSIGFSGGNRGTFQNHVQHTLNLHLSYKAGQEMTKQQKLVPQRNFLSIGQSQSEQISSKSTSAGTEQSGSFLVTGLLIKKVSDNLELANQILDKHFSFGSHVNNQSSPKNMTVQNSSSISLPPINNRNSNESDKNISGTEWINHQSKNVDFIKQLEKEGENQKKKNNKKPPKPQGYKTQAPSNYSPIKRKQKPTIRNSYDVLYSGIKVCRQCHEIYLLLQDYFDELNENITGKITDEQQQKVINDQRKSQDPRSSSIGSILQQARAFSHSNMDLNYLEKKKLKGGESRNRSMILGTINEITVANVKGRTLIEQGANAGHNNSQQHLLKVEGFVKIEDIEQSMTKSGLSASTTKLTESRKLKVAPKISLKFVQTEGAQDFLNHQEEILQQTYHSLQDKIHENIGSIFKTTGIFGKLQKQAQNAKNGQQQSAIKLEVNSSERSGIKDKQMSSTLNKKNPNVMSNNKLLKSLKKSTLKIGKASSKSLLNMASVANTLSDKSQIQMKTNFALALRGLFQKHEAKFYKDKAREIREQKRIINFYLEVSKNISKYALHFPYFDFNAIYLNGRASVKRKSQISGQPVSNGRRLSRLTPDIASHAMTMDINIEQFKEPQSHHQHQSHTPPPENIITVMDGGIKVFGVQNHVEKKRDSSRMSQINVFDQNLLGTITKIVGDSVNPLSQNTKSKRSMRLLDVANKQPEQTHELFKGSRKVSNAIMQNVMSLLSQQMSQIAVQPINLKNNSRHRSSFSLNPGETKLAKFDSASPIKSARQHQVVEQQHANPTLTNSIFHFTNLAHIQHVPFYRISTPKAPIYTFNEQIKGQIMNRENNQNSNRNNKQGVIMLGGKQSPQIMNHIKKNLVKGIGSITNLNDSKMTFSTLHNQVSTKKLEEISPQKHGDVNQIGLHRSKVMRVLETNDDLYIIPQENYQTMSIENYVELLAHKRYSEEVMGKNTKRNLHILEREGCQVFFVDEYTSMIYLILQSSESRDTSEIFSPNGSQNNSDKGLQEQVFLVLLDFYDSFLDKVDYFQNLITDATTRIILINFPGQQGTQFNFNKYPEPVLNNAYYSTCLDLLLYHLHERGTLNCLDQLQCQYSLVGFGNGANIALYYSQMMMNDTTSTLRQLIMINPYSYMDASMQQSFVQATESLKNSKETEHNLVIMDNLLHSSEGIQQKHQVINVNDSLENGGDNFQEQEFNGKWEWIASHKDKTLICNGVMQNIPLKDKMQLFKDSVPQFGEPMEIHILYSKTNHFVPYKQIEDIVKASQEKSKQQSHVKVQFIAGGHDALRDNADGVHLFLCTIMDQGENDNMLLREQSSTIILSERTNNRVGVSNQPINVMISL